MKTNADGTRGMGSQLVRCSNPNCRFTDPENPYTLRRSPSVLKERNYCDYKCRDTDKTRPKIGRPPSPPKEETTDPCAYCGEPVPHLVSDKRTKFFCDRAHAAKMPRLKRAGRPRGRTTGLKSVNNQGYVMVYVGPEHPMAGRAGVVGEHRLVMSEILGRSLLSGENVHHKNANRQDNRPENLELWVGIGSQPSGLRVLDLLDWAREIIARYEPFEGWLRSMS